MHEILPRRSPRRRNQLCQILSQSDQAFRFCGGSNFWLSHRSHQMSPLTHGLNCRSACDLYIVDRRWADLCEAQDVKQEQPQSFTYCCVLPARLACIIARAKIDRRCRLSACGLRAICWRSATSWSHVLYLSSVKNSKFMNKNYYKGPFKLQVAFRFLYRLFYIQMIAHYLHIMVCLCVLSIYFNVMLVRLSLASKGNLLTYLLTSVITILS